MLGGSPIRVAVPCRLEAMARAIRKVTGETFSRRDISRAMGATISTVATFSTKAEMTLVSAQIHSTATPTVEERLTSRAARRAGTRDRMNSSASTSVPAKMPMTFQLMSLRIWPGVTRPKMINRPMPIHRARAR